MGPVVTIPSDAQDPGKLLDKKTPDIKQPPVKPPDVAQPPPEQAPQSQDNNELGESTSGFNPHLMGDFPLIFALQKIGVCSLRTTTTTFVPSFSAPTITSTSTCMVSQTRLAYVPVLSLGAFNVAENESPRPQDRVFGFYNYFSDLRGPDIGSGGPLTTTTTTTATVPASGTITTTTTTTNPGVARPSLDLNREVVGFEKTFFDGRASVEIRLPFLQAQGGVDFTGSIVGDLTLVSKYAFLLDRETGNVFSAGLALTLPSGPSLDTIDGNFRDTLIQPFFGYIYNFPNFYIQGIHSIAVPTNAQDITIMFNDVSIDYWLYRGSPNQFLSAVVPTLEAHLTTPLNHRGASDNNLLFIPDVLVLTSGAHFGLYGNTTVSVGAAVPVTGPSVFAIEGFVQFNWRF